MYDAAGNQNEGPIPKASGASRCPRWQSAPSHLSEVIAAASKFCQNAQNMVWNSVFIRKRWTYAVCLGAGFAILLATASQAADLRRVLLLHSFGRDFSPWGEMAESFRSELVDLSRTPIDFYEASIVSPRSQGPEEEEALFKYLRDLPARRKLDLVVTFGALATRFVQRHRSQLFSATPMLVSGTEERRIPVSTLTTNDAVVSFRADIPAIFENILRVRPETTNIVVVIGNSSLEQFWVSQMRRDLQRFTKSVSITWWNELSLDKMEKQVAQLTPRSALLYTFVAVDAEGVPHALNRAFAPIHSAAKVPIFGIADYQLGQGIVGGPLIPFESEGKEAAHIAFRILNGERPSELRLPPLSLTAPLYDWRELNRWNISEARLPTGSVVQFREPSAWEEYRWLIALIAATLFVQSLLIAGLIVEYRRRIRAELVARHRLSELAHLNRSAAIGAMSASIAHEINQPLAAIASSGYAGLRWLANQTPNLDKAKAALKRIVSDSHRASEVVEAVKAMFKKGERQRTLVIVDNLIESVLSLLRIELAEYQVSVRLMLNKNGPQVRADPIQLQQVILNLIRNAIDAMESVTDRARVLRIKSEATETDVIVTIEDSGSGIDAKDKEHIFESFFSTKSNGMGMGLSICRAIIEYHGGSLSASSNKPYGAVFQIALPIAGANEREQGRTSRDSSKDGARGGVGLRH
jgi:signal transduction histidine kinase